MMCTYNLSTEEAESGRILYLMTSQPCLVGRFQVNERPCLKRQGGWYMRNGTLGCFLASTHAYTCIHTCTWCEHDILAMFLTNAQGTAASFFVFGCFWYRVWLCSSDKQWPLLQPPSCWDCKQTSELPQTASKRASQARHGLDKDIVAKAILWSDKMVDKV